MKNISGLLPGLSASDALGHRTESAAGTEKGERGGNSGVPAAEDGVRGGAGAAPGPDLAIIRDRDWRVAEERYDAIRPILEGPPRNGKAVRERAEALGKSSVTLYRWVKKYETVGKVSSLLPSELKGGPGKSRLGAPVEDVIRDVIAKFYLSSQRRSPQKTFVEVARRCRAAGLPLPSANTVRNRIAVLPEQTKVERRFGRKLANEKFSPIRGPFPGADWPLAVVQIDHTKLDVVLVDDETRTPIGRPWITVAIDVFSRMVAGFHVSFDPPGSASVGLCLAHAILPKETWLAGLGLSSPWPVWGLMDVIHADNAKEFHGRMLEMACKEYGIRLEWRPVKLPKYGGHIERLMGTFAKEIHALPGTTFSNVSEKGDYRAEKKAAVSLAEFEKWLATFIAQVYHQRIHRGLGMSPLKKYEEGILGTGASPARGLPRPIPDEKKLRLDFLPCYERSVQAYGMVLDEVHYYSDFLRPWIKASEAEDPKRRRKFVVRRDPRDIGVIYFFDPELKRYFAIPYRDASRPSISLWEMREAKRRLRVEGRRGIDEDRIFRGIGEMREIEEEAALRTAKAKRRGSRRPSAGASPVRPIARRAGGTGSGGKTEENAAENSWADIQPFEEREILG